jgi:hypothetical protein
MYIQDIVMHVNMHACNPIFVRRDNCRDAPRLIISQQPTHTQIIPISFGNQTRQNAYQQRGSYRERARDSTTCPAGGADADEAQEDGD